MACTFSKNEKETKKTVYVCKQMRRQGPVLGLDWPDWPDWPDLKENLYGQIYDVKQPGQNKIYDILLVPCNTVSL